jgi:antitoxin (DNA-binding transcriptional repressor) of toxin-antitoxin stability system
MKTVDMEQLQSDADRLVALAESGEEITITRDGVPVARLTRMKPALTSEEMLRRCRGLPPMDLAELRRDLDEVIDPSL